MGGGPTPEVRAARRDLRFFPERFSARCFSTVQGALSRLLPRLTFPSVAEVNGALSALAGQHFVEQQRHESMSYDARIVERGEVPTRTNDWHDLMNALVWATFPKAKLALHRRQLRLVTARAGGPHRTREEDTVAILDEAGVVITPSGPLVFGHAVYEAFALGTPLVSLRALRLHAVTPSVDEALAAAIADPMKLLEPPSLEHVKPETLA